MAVRTTGSVLGLDPGAVRIGVSISDSRRTMAFPRPALAAGEGLEAAVRSLVLDEEVAIVIVGLPRSLSGREGAAATAARALAAALAESLADLEVTIELHDERLTTVEAAARLTRSGRGAADQRAVIDSAAATVLLESWLDAQ